MTEEDWSTAEHYVRTVLEQGLEGDMFDKALIYVYLWMTVGPDTKSFGAFAEMLSVPGGPGLLLDHRKRVVVIGHTPAMAVLQALGVALALLHQRVLGMHEAAFDPRGFIGAHGVKAAHRSFSVIPFLPDTLLISYEPCAMSIARVRNPVVRLREGTIPPKLHCPGINQTQRRP